MFQNSFLFFLYIYIYITQQRDIYEYVQTFKPKKSFSEFSREIVKISVFNLV